jgi:MFS family permease
MLKRLYISNVILSIGYALTAYISSLFLAEFIHENTVGVLFACASLLALIIFRCMPFIVCRIGNKHTLLGVLFISIVSLLVLSLGISPILIATAFVVFQAANTISFYLFDLLIEHFATNDSLGETRGAYLALGSFGWVLAQLMTGSLLLYGGYNLLYGITALSVVLVLFLLLGFLRNYHDTVCRPMPDLSAFSYFGKHPNIARITIINMALQLFYSWMVIYASIYLIHDHGFTAETLGPVFAVMLLAFVFFEYPFGKLTDRIGVQKILFGGLMLMALATLVFAYTTISIPWIVALILFATRTGAAAVEVASETYFFKNVSAGDVKLISLFRSARPLTLLIAPLIASLILSFNNSYTLLFTILAGIIFSTAFLTFQINETKS